MKVRWIWAMVLASQPAAAQVLIGAGSDALPALGHVGVPDRSAGKVVTAVDVGYRLIEPLDTEKGSHHGGTATIGLAVPVAPWFAVGASLSGSVMVHPDDQMGSDRSGAGHPALAVRLGEWSTPLRYAVELEGAFPGRDAPSVDLAATTLRAKGMLSYVSPGNPWVPVMNIGYVWDNTARAAPPISTMRQGDRVALGASSFDAIAVGLGIVYRAAPLAAFGELSADLLYSAPRIATSPARAGVGVRFALSESVQLEARVQVGLSARQDFDARNYQPYEPRFAAFAGPRIAWGVETPAVRRHTSSRPALPVQSKPPPPPVVAPPPVVHVVVGSVTNESENPLPQVTVKLKVGEWERVTETDVTGAYRFEDVPDGTMDVSLSTVDFEPALVSISGGSKEAEIRVPVVHLKVQVLGAQVQGVIRGFKGEIPPATIHLTPGDRTSKTDAEGKFTLEVGPGEYRVTVSAPGYEPQTRTINVEAHGVVIVNADLRAR